ncbi:MAG: zinc-ribbon domain-containing protein, partial [Bacilli bacterium]
MSKFCSNCGKEVDDKAVVCVSCGASLQEEKVVKDPNAKSKLAAGLLGIFLGSFGV